MNEGSEDAGEIWAPDTLDEQRSIRGQLKTNQLGPLRKLIYVIDGSSAMGEHFDTIARAILKQRDQKIETHVLLAADEVHVMTNVFMVGSDAQGLAKFFHKETGVGGCDNVPALAQAWDLAARVSGASVIWVHGPQPVQLASYAGLHRRWEHNSCGGGCLTLRSGIVQAAFLNIAWCFHA